MQLEFQGSSEPTLGVEWELAFVDRATGDLVSVADEVLAQIPPPEDGHPARVHRELLLNTVELVTGVCRSVPEAVDDLRQSLELVRAVTDPRGIDLFSAGSHPFADATEQLVTEGERYSTLIDRTQWWGRQMLIYGVHVHVGVPSGDRALAILNGLLPYYPHLQVLSASSPYWGGIDTAYASNRALMFQQLPTAGLPFQFGSWAEFEAYVGDMFETGVVDEYKEIRWDLRPSPSLGTLEVRVCDGLPTLLEVGAVAALTQCLVVDLGRRLDAGEALPALPPWHVQENKWRVARYGTEAIVILDATNRERLVTDDVRDLGERLAPLARELGCERELRDVEVVLATGSSADRQRAVAEAAGGDLRAVVASLVAELEAGRPLPVGRTS
ncbi:MAG: glutamate--cysteine ligase [Candidatus Nanopelagicales bacterium]